MSADVLICLIAPRKWDRASAGLAGAGQRLAAELGGALHALVVAPASPGIAGELAQLARSVTVVESDRPLDPEPLLATAAAFARELDARAVLLGNDSASQELTPRLAARLGGSPLGDAGEVTFAGGRIQVTRAVYGGKAVATYALARSPAVVWVRARAQAAGVPSTDAGAVRTTLAFQPATAFPRVVERFEEPAEGVSLEEARVVVAGGRGIGGAEGFRELAALAGVMEAALGCSRPVCDEGWAPASWQVGQTGKRVAPDLYLAVAISGASQHVLGMADSRVVAAINTDPQAAIFANASFGIVGDYRKIVPALTARLAERRR
ncbi:MAG: electron transfer flavoprotein subunit alpha/FixB family protein [Thermoanaerobaculia bacterium]